MDLLTKFESKSSSAKAIAFHPRRPWILVALYSSTVQLWDYRMGSVIARFEGHEGPVRCVDFHPSQQMFVSCGDDSTVRVWSLQTRKELFTLHGHFDYVRTAFFHPDLPWIISASDDQTIRIWNWQNRKQIAILTGHNHWVTCAQFHPTNDLVVSSSLDTEVRVWDISGLRKKHSAPAQMLDGGHPGGPAGIGMGMAPPSQEQDAFGAPTVQVKWVLEGHDRGVNWAAFHPTLPLIVSAGDDRVLKVWRTSETRAWEVDTCRGHTNNVTSCLFHPYQDLIVSVSDDKTMRTWDLNRRTLVHTFKRDSDKFWNVAFHPTINLLGATHDSGVIVFKFERERPPFALHQGQIVFATRDKNIKSFDPRDPVDRQGPLTLKKFGTPYTPLRDLSYNAAEKAVLVTGAGEAASSTGKAAHLYMLAKLPADPVGPVEPTRPLEGTGDQAIFVTRNRFAVFQAEQQTLEIRDMENAVTKTLPLPIVTKFISATPIPGNVLLLGAKSVVLFDIQQKKVTAKLAVRNVKYASWSNDGKHVALLAKHLITTATRDLVRVTQFHETVRIKSAAWDESDVLFYTTFNHLKYALLSGDVGVLKTQNQTLYVVQVRGNSVYCLARGGSVHIIKVDPTEYRFKRALINGNLAEVRRLIKTSHLVGQSIIAYLQKVGYPEIALKFVEDPQTKFDLAIECGNLGVAAEQGVVLNKTVADNILAKEALEQGNHDIVEDIYQKQHDFDKLSFLYLITGNKGRLQKMEQIAGHRGDTAARFQTSIFLGTVESRIQLLRDAGLDSLAYALAKSNGLHAVEQQILAESGRDSKQIDVPVHDISKEPVLGVAHETFKSNWPLRPRPGAEFLLEGGDDDATAPEADAEDTDALGAADDGLDALADELDELDVGGGEDDGAWGLDVGDDIEDGPEEAAVGAGSATETERERWLRSSHVPADHVAAGSFETAAQLLNRQVGVTNFAPLKKRFLQVYEASKLYLRAHEGLPPLEFYVKRSADLPFVPGLEALSAQVLEGYKLVKANKVELAIDTFRDVLYTALLLSVEPKEVAEVRKIIEISRNYILAFTIELKRRALPEGEIKRNLELAAYFTKPALRPAHASLPYQIALMQAFTHKNYALASHFAGEFLKLVKTGPSAEKVKKIKARADANPLDAVDIDFDTFAEFDIDPISLTPIYEGQPKVVDPFTGAAYHAAHKGQQDVISGLTTVGAAASGLRLSNE